MENFNSILTKKIEDGNASIGIVGLGYVGLPLALEFSKKFHTYGFDTDESIVNRLNSGESHIIDISSEMLSESLQKDLVITSNLDDLQGVDFVIICVPTPLKDGRIPDLSYVEAAALDISKILSVGQFVILESTTFPGTTETYLKQWLEQGSDLKHSIDFGLAFSPERVDPGNKKFTIVNTPKVVGGLTDEETNTASKLYDSIVEAGIIEVKNARTAESVKLMENIFRNINIALVNEMTLIMERLDVDIHDVIESASTKPFGFMPFYPGPGIGGHCIPLDPYYLSYISRQKGIMPRFIELSGDINEFMKIKAVNMVEDKLTENGRKMFGSKIGVMGLSYKKDINDTRESPSIDIIDDIISRGAEVEVFDPFVNEVSTKYGSFESVGTPNDLFKNKDAILILVDHSKFLEYDYEMLANTMKIPILVDAKGLLRNNNLNNVQYEKF